MSRTDSVFMQGTPPATDSSDPSTVDLSTDERDATAARLGMTCVMPGPRDLFLDLDGEAVNVDELLTLAEAAGLHVVRVDVWPSKTPGHYHALLSTDFDLTPMLRCALQCALGSDRKRELLSLARIVRNTPAEPTVFFEGIERAAWLKRRAASTAPELVEDDIPW